jgi:uncharacterized surface protein with fasciclin (FAS1) repeats
MVSLQGNHEPNDLRYTYYIKDLRSSVPEPMSRPEHIFGLIQDNSDFSIFYHMIIKAELYGIYNDLQANLTLFVPSNEYLLQKYSPQFFENMDQYTAREIVLFHTLNKKISYEMLTSSKAMYLNTMVDESVYSRLLCESCSNMVTLNCNVHIKIPNIYRKNGLIHVVDGLMIPPALSY